MKRRPNSIDLFQNHDTPIMTVERIKGNSFEFQTRDGSYVVHVAKGIFRSRLLLDLFPYGREVIHAGRHADCVTRLYSLRDTLYRRMRDREEDERRQAEEEQRAIEAANGASAEDEMRTKSGSKLRNRIGDLAPEILLVFVVVGVLISMIATHTVTDMLIQSERQGGEIRTLSPEDFSSDVVESYLENLEESDFTPRYEEPVPVMEEYAAPESANPSPEPVVLAPRGHADNATSGNDLLERFYSNSKSLSSRNERQANLKRVWDERKNEDGISDIPGPDTFTAIKGTAQVPTPGGGNLTSLAEVTEFGLDAQ